jgi:hypothetical protein
MSIVLSNATQPNTVEWGPHLWRIFHSLVEKTGRVTLNRQQAEEARIWNTFLMSLRKSIPCIHCRKHYNDYLLANPYIVILTKVGIERQNKLREWFYIFHNSVNTRTGKTYDKTLEDLPTIYGSYSLTDFNTDRAILLDNMRRAIQTGFVIRDDLQKSLRSLDELWLLIGS